MVQQNLVSYIIAQVRQGKTLQEVNDFLINGGYDKQEVESSVQYVLNLEKNPGLAEEQRIQQLADYIKQQMSSGYEQKTIANFLLSRGYPYYEVNSALQQATTPKKIPTMEHRAVILALVIMFLMTTAVTILYIKAYVFIGAPPEKLLDVETEQLTTLVQQGGELSFEISLINFGYEKRFDVVLTYHIIDRDTQKTVLEKSETVALSTTLERISSFDIPETLKSGRYVLRTDATYGDFTATSGFIFDVLPKGAAEEKIEEIREQLPPKEKEEEIPELEPERPEELPEEVPEEAPEELPPVQVPEAEEERPFYEGMTKDQAFERVKVISAREPERAIEMCQSFKYEGTQEQCIQMIAEFKETGSYCENIERDRFKNNCYLEVARTTSNYDWCNSITDANVRQSCQMFETITAIQQTRPEDMQQEELFSLLVKAQGA